MNRSQFNILQTIFIKNEFEKIYNDDTNISRIIINEKYDRLNNELQISKEVFREICKKANIEREFIWKDLKKLILSENLILKEEIN